MCCERKWTSLTLHILHYRRSSGIYTPKWIVAAFKLVTLGRCVFSRGKLVLLRTFLEPSLELAICKLP